MKARLKKDGTPWKTTQGMKFPIEVLTSKEIETILKAISRKSSIGIRNKALVVFGCWCGLRISEVLNLDIRDIDFEGSCINIRQGKGAKQRITGLDSATASIVQRWLERRKKLGIPGKGRIFCTLQGKPLSASYVRIFMNRIGKKAELNKRVHFHALRHFYAAQEVQNGTTIPELAGDLGHANIKTTHTYVNHVSPLARIMRAKNRKREIPKGV